MDERCESCRVNKVSITEEIEDGPPYKICKECHHRLVNRALRPLEYFNLTARHGHAYLLHDDFYDDETGEATASRIEIVDPDKFPFPVLDEIKHDTNRLIDFAIVQFFTDNIVINLIKNNDPARVLDILNKRLQDNEDLKYKLLDIAANALGPFAESWVRQIWKRRKQGDELSIYAEALAKCLPFNEAFEELCKEIEREDDKRINNKIGNLIYFERPETLDWIEKVKGKINNVSQSWGNLAAASGFEWTRAKKWIDEGRPLSLISLDALMYCTTIGNQQNQIPWFQKHPPKLINPEKPEVIATILNEYLKTDKAPRAKTTVNTIISNLFK